MGKGMSCGRLTVWLHISRLGGSESRVVVGVVVVVWALERSRRDRTCYEIE